jgi:hypothetical protein
MASMPRNLLGVMMGRPTSFILTPTTTAMTMDTSRMLRSREEVSWDAYTEADVEKYGNCKRSLVKARSIVSRGVHTDLQHP